MPCAGRPLRGGLCKSATDEGVANHIDPEPCADRREAVCEASAGKQTGQSMGRDGSLCWMPTCGRCLSGNPIIPSRGNLNFPTHQRQGATDGRGRSIDERLAAHTPKAVGRAAATVSGSHPEAEDSVIGKQQWQGESSGHGRRTAGKSDTARVLGAHRHPDQALIESGDLPLAAA